MGSPGHRANILRSSYDRVGVGVLYDPSGGGTMYVTVVFGDSDGTNDPPAPSDPVPLPEPPPSPCIDAACDGFAVVDDGGRWTLFDRVADRDPDTFYFGNPGDIPFMGDWNGDGEATPGLYRQSDGFVYLKDSNSQGVADREFYFGIPGDFPVVGDWNGDGKDTVSIHRGSEGRFYIVNELGENGGGLGPADFSFLFGNPGDSPLVGDFDDDGVDSIGLYRESVGFAHLRNSLTSGAAESSFFYGNPGDQVVAGDWDGDGVDTVAVYRPSLGRVYVNLVNGPGVADWNAYIGVYRHIVSAS